MRAFYICFVFVLLGCCDIHNQKELSYIALLQKQNAQLGNLKILSKLQHAGEGMQLKDICLYRESGDSLQINQIFGTTRKIIFFFSELGCASCYMPFLENAIGRQDALKEKLVIVAGFENQKDFKIYMQDRNIPFEIFRIRTNFNIFPEYNDYALAFLSDKNCVVDNLFIIDSSNVGYVDDYLQIVCQKIGV